MVHALIRDYLSSSTNVPPYFFQRNCEHDLCAFVNIIEMNTAISLLRDAVTEVYPVFGSTETTDASDSLTEAMLRIWSYRMVVAVYIWFPPVLLIGGTIGNFLVIAVSRTPHFKRSPATILMLLLACSDLFILHTQLTRFWLKSLVSINLDPKTDIGCQFLSFASYVGFDTSSMTVVMISIERAVTVTQPLKAKSWLTRKRISRVWISLVTAFLLINAHFFWTMQYNPYASQRSAGETYTVSPECHLRKDTELMRTISDIWYYVDFCLFAGVPIPLVVGANIIIVLSLKTSHNRRQKMQASQHEMQLPEQNVDIKKKPGTSQLTVMLLLMSSGFCLCTFPVIVYPFIVNALFPNVHIDLESFGLAYLVNAFLGMLLFLNYAINFMLYCLGGTKFRLALKEMLCCCKEKKTHSQAPNPTLSTE
ncbi:hypothetical protein CAPTEDRAFT_213628 [Capitella teleta]|uniref:G-protein coupled receptors family 1 profile domain-containing protein n=1 Tax=Capitella teleta TaxID=283909 RepID=R7VC30_CAPTE|nr:hypothetical protein CAPTEDRAFT_213628 [Capitella teleta]|eukprot:ELU16408.1 hypothetical protein CAPTEDRAFT_213628 [Capitella teleta]